MTTRKKREEMSTEELRQALKEDCEKVLGLLAETVNDGLDLAPKELLDQGDSFIILQGALSALEYRYMEMLQEKMSGNGEVKVPAANKKFYN